MSGTAVDGQSIRVFVSLVDAVLARGALANLHDAVVVEDHAFPRFIGRDYNLARLPCRVHPQHGRHWRRRGAHAAAAADAGVQQKIVDHELSLARFELDAGGCTNCQHDRSGQQDIDW